CICPPPQCAPGQNCGTVTNACGDSVSCGTCTPPLSCGAAGTPGICSIVENPCGFASGGTTATCLRSRDNSPGGCYQCAVDLGCVAPTFNGKAGEDLGSFANNTCQSVLGPPSVPTESQFCMATLNSVFTSHCASGLQINPCLCGNTPPDTCQN